MKEMGNFPGDSVAKTLCSQCGGHVQSQVRKLDPTLCNEKILHATAMARTAPQKAGWGADSRRTGWSLGGQGGLYFFFYDYIAKLVNPPNVRK